jgi:uncharacterized protein (TIGR03437 family)
MPITVQANAPQLCTDDGKHVAATHADGTPVGPAGLFPGGPATTPAMQGETVTLFGTGPGPTTPALIASQMPAQAFPLATLPQVSIGGGTANVVSESVVPSAPGIYQIKVVVPAAQSGGQPVIVTVGGVNSASTLITIQ